MLEHPNLHLTPDEKSLFGQLFSAADSDKLGVVTGEVAVKFFEKTRLSPAILGEVGKGTQGLLPLPLSAKPWLGIDMANRRRGESGAPDQGWIWHSSKINRICSSWPAGIC